MEATSNDPQYTEGFLAPVVLTTLLHVCYICDPLPLNGSVQASLECLQKAGLIKRTPRKDISSGWDLTARGIAHVTQLRQMPFPVPRDGWMNPITKQALT